MASLDDFLEGLGDDLEKDEQEEAQAPSASSAHSTKVLARTSEQTVKDVVVPVNSKKPRVALQPVQVVRRKTELQKEVISAVQPTINKEYLQELLGVHEQRPHSNNSATQTPTPPLPAAPAAREQYVFQSKPFAKSSVAEPGNEPCGHRLFVGNLSAEARDENLLKVFKDYPTAHDIHVVLDSANKERCKGFGFVSFTDPFEMLRALREKNGKLCGNRPMIISKAKGPSKSKA